MVTAFLTSFYTFRAFYLTFYGEEKVPHEAGDHAHESPPVMWVPLVILAVCAALAGLVREYLAPFSKEGWPEGGPNPENPRDRARQENALLASVEKGQALLKFHTRWVANRLEPGCEAVDETVAALRERLAAPCLGDLHYTQDDVLMAEQFRTFRL